MSWKWKWYIISEPSSSTHYNSPIFLVNKKDGSKQLVIDLRRVNSLIVPKLVQLPQIDEMLDTITAEKPKFIMISDVSSAFWQVGVEEKSRDVTSFTAPDGRIRRFTCAPFGLNNSPSVLQKTLGELFSDKSRFGTFWCTWTISPFLQICGKVIWSS